MAGEEEVTPNGGNVSQGDVEMSAPAPAANGNDASAANGVNAKSVPVSTPAPGAPAAGGHAGSHKGLTTAEAEEFHAAFGYNEVKTKQTPEWQKIAWRYLDWVSLVILAAAIVSVAVENEGDRAWTSFTLLIIELNMIVWVGYFTDKNAGNAVKELEELSAPHTVALRDGKWTNLPVRELCMGDVIQLKGGDVIPADAQLIGEGEPLKIDESSLTGESLPVSRKPGDKILGGAVVSAGELDATIIAVGENTFFGKTLMLLGQPQERGHLQTVLGRVSAALGLIALLGVIVILAVLLGVGNSAGYSVSFVMVIFVSVVPIGMPVVTAAVLAVGAREMVREKAIVSRLSALEELSGMEVLASDKTGTLTLNKLALDKSEIVPWGDNTADDVLMEAVLSAKWGNADAIDTAVTNTVGGDKSYISAYTIKRFIPFNPVDKKTSAYVIRPDGREMVTAKGAPQIIGDLLTDEKAKAEVDTYIIERAQRGLRALGVAHSFDNGETWDLVGLIALLDPPREDSAATIKLAQSLGVEVKMVTGDQVAIAVETSKRLGLGTNIMEGKSLMEAGESKEALDDLAKKVDEVDGFAGVYPEHKYRIVEALQARGRLIGMTGDGVNDAPALKRANVGIAVAGATDAAKGAADIILTEEGISTIITAIIRSRIIFRRLESYIIYRMASSLTILGFFFFAVIILDFEFPTWSLVLVSLTNDLSVMATSFDNVHSSQSPELWNMTKCLSVAFALALINTMGLMLLLCLALPQVLNWWHWYNISVGVDGPGARPPTPSEINGVMYFALTALIQLSIFSTRNPSVWYHFSKKSSPVPSIFLVLPVLLFVSASMFLGVYWPYSVQPDGGRASMEGAGWVAIAVTFFYVIVLFHFSDFAKFLMQRVFAKYDRTIEAAKNAGTPPPKWCQILDAPGNAAERFSEVVEDLFGSMFTACAKPFKKMPGVAERPLSESEIQAEMAARLSFRDKDGGVPATISDSNELHVQLPHRPLGSKRGSFRHGPLHTPGQGHGLVPTDATAVDVPGTDEARPHTTRLQRYSMY